MKAALLIICILLAATAVLCESNSNIKKKIKKFVGGCSKTVEEMDISGTEGFKPSEKEAKEKLMDLKKLLKIMKIPDEEERERKLKEDPELEVLKKKLKSVENMLKLPKIDAEAALNHDYELLKTVVQMSYLDPKNKNSPVYGQKLSELLGLKHKAGHLKRRKISRHDNVRLLYSKVIPPGQKLPDATKVFYTDKKGRSCRCMC